MALTEADIEQFIAALHEDPQLKDRVRNAILSDDFLTLPGIVERLGERVEQLGARVDQLGQRMDQLSVRVDQLGQRMDQLSVRVDQLGLRMEQLTEQVQQLGLKMDRHDGRLGNLEGEAYESRYVLNLGSHLARTLRNVRQVVPADLDGLSAAYRAGSITDSEWDDLHRLDVLAVGRPVKGLAAEPERYYAIELSLVVDESDIDRAARRAAILQSHGVNAAPAVDGRAITSDAEQKAFELGVEVLVRKVQPAA